MACESAINSTCPEGFTRCAPSPPPPGAPAVRDELLMVGAAVAAMVIGGVVGWAAGRCAKKKGRGYQPVYDEAPPAGDTATLACDDDTRSRDDATHRPV